MQRIYVSNTSCQIVLLLLNLVYYKLSQRVISVGHICMEAIARCPTPMVLMVLLGHVFDAQLLHRTAVANLQTNPAEIDH